LEPSHGIEPAEAEMDEAIDGLASMILYSSQIDKRQVFMVSSAMPGEGKSTVSCQLAQSLARAGKSVALVDFDLRRPSIHRYLDLTLDPGLAQSLFGEISFEDTLQKTTVENLSVMTAGDWHGNLQERCTAGTVTDLFDYLRSTFDLVVVDSSPVLPVHDTRVIGKFTDGVILTLVRDKSRLSASAQACEILRSFGATLLGTVMIGASTYSGYSGYSGYSPYSTYGKSSRSKRLISK
jgi:receptor protein-tyrosine kinase